MSSELHSNDRGYSVGQKLHYCATTKATRGPKSTLLCNDKGYTWAKNYIIVQGLFCTYTVSGKKRGHVIFNYNSRISRSIFIIFVPLKTGMNTLQLCVIYLLKCLMTS